MNTHTSFQLEFLLGKMKKNSYISLSNPFNIKFVFVMMLNPKLKLILNTWSKVKNTPKNPATLRDVSAFSMTDQIAILRKTFKKLLATKPNKADATDFLFLGACGYKGELKDDKPFISIGEMTKYKAFINKKVKEKDAAKGKIYIEDEDTICFLFQKGKIKNEAKAKKLLKPLKTLLNKFNIKLLFSESTEDQAEGDQLRPESVQLSYHGKAPQMNAAAEAVLRDILAKSGEEKVFITSTLRSPAEQGKIICKNIAQYGAAFNLKYYNGNGKALVEAFVKAKKAGKDSRGIVEAVTNAINKIGPAKVSDHCNPQNPAIDIHPTSIKDVAKFNSILTADSRVQAICPPKDPFYHIVVKG